MIKWYFVATLLVGLICGSIQAKAKAPFIKNKSSFKRTIHINITTYTITGTVKSYAGVLGGALIAVKGIKITTTTNEIGYFKLTVPANADSLIVELKGYQSKVIAISSGKKNYEVVLNLPKLKLLANEIPPYDISAHIEGRFRDFIWIGNPTPPIDNTARIWYNIWTK